MRRLLPLLILSLLPASSRAAQCSAGEFATNPACTLPGPKVDAKPLPAGANVNQYQRASDFNALRNALNETRDHVSGWVNVKSYGAKGDGVTDDTAAIGLALAAANGKRLYFPDGAYLARNVAVANAVTIEGAGRGRTTIKLPALAAADGSPIFLVSANDVSFRDLTLDGNKSAQPADGFSDSWNSGTSGTGRAYRALVRAYGSGDLSGLTVERCGLVNAYGAAIAARNVSRVKIRDNDASGNNFEAGYVVADVDAAGIEITGNDVRSTGSGHASINANAFLLSEITGAVISNNRVITVERNGLKCEGCSTVAIQGNVVENVSVANFGALQLQGASTNVLIAGNVSRNTGAGITLNCTGSSSGITITGNVVDTTIGPTTGDAISVASSANYTGVSIIGNTLTNVLRFGVYVAPTGVVTGLTVAGNTCKSTGDTGASGVRLYANGASWTNITVSANTLDMGDVAVSLGAISIQQAAAETIGRLTVTGNILRVGAGHHAIRELSAIVTSGIYGSNLTDGNTTLAGTWIVPVLPSVSADRGDTSQTLTVRADAQVQRWATTLTANRTVTLSTTGAQGGDTFRVVRTGLGAFTLDVGGLKTIPSATAAFVDVVFDGSAWRLTGYGTL